MIRFQTTRQGEQTPSLMGLSSTHSIKMGTSPLTLPAVPTAVARGGGALPALAHVGVQGKVHRFKFEHDLLGG